MKNPEVQNISLIKPMLGEVSAITMTSPDLGKSLLFWNKLGFENILQMHLPFPWIQISDGAILIMLKKDSTPYFALTYYVKDILKVADDLEQIGINFIQKPNDVDYIKKYIFQTPDGLTINLVSMMEGFLKPAGTTLISLPRNELFTPEKYTNKKCGLFIELSTPVRDLDVSTSFWEKLGFFLISKTTFPYPRAIVSDGLSIVGLHQTNKFSKPALTFFAEDMEEKIDVLRREGICKPATGKDKSNIILRTPEDQSINLFTPEIH